MKNPHSWPKIQVPVFGKEGEQRAVRALKSWMLGCHLVLQDPGMGCSLHSSCHTSAPGLPRESSGQAQRVLNELSGNAEEWHNEPISPWILPDLNELLRNSGLELEEEYVMCVYICTHKKSQQVELQGSDSLPCNVVWKWRDWDTWTDERVVWERINSSCFN